MGQTNGAKNSHFTHQGQLKEPLGNGPVVWEHGIPGLAHWVLRRGGSRPTLVVTWRSLRILKVWQPWNLELKIKQSNRCYLKLNWWKIAKLKLGWGLIISLYHKCSITERCVNLKKKKKNHWDYITCRSGEVSKVKEEHFKNKIMQRFAQTPSWSHQISNTKCLRFTNHKHLLSPTESWGVLCPHRIC